MTDTLETNWYSDDMATFGDRVAAARDAQGLSQKTLAHKLGVNVKTLDKWENDLSEPRANKLQMMAGVLNVSLSWLLTGDGHGLETPPDASAEVTDLMTEMRLLRTQLGQAADRIGVLEKRLKSAISDTAA
ncbi:MAG: helix-turn-helix domain-containing protein [Pseudomonadota bacterium]